MLTKPFTVLPNDDGINQDKDKWNVVLAVIEVEKIQELDNTTIYF
jgi:hypothetical protein